eukprot:354845-Chlamydomonas_euryale.AAC.4
MGGGGEDGVGRRVRGKTAAAVSRLHRHARCYTGMRAVRSDASIAPLTSCCRSHASTSGGVTASFEISCTCGAMCGPKCGAQPCVCGKKAGRVASLRHFRPPARVGQWAGVVKVRRQGSGSRGQAVGVGQQGSGSRGQTAGVRQQGSGSSSQAAGVG